MAKSSHKPRKPEKPSTDAPESPETSSVAVEAAPTPPPQQHKPQPNPKASENISSIDAETNARYESVKGGKLFIKDLQVMDLHSLHELARAENIQDYVGLKKQDLIFQILRARARQKARSKSFLMDSDSFDRPNTTISPAPTISTSRHRKSDALVFATATSCKARSVPRRNRNDILRSFALKRSMAKIRKKSPTLAILKT